MGQFHPCFRLQIYYTTAPYKKHQHFSINFRYVQGFFRRLLTKKLSAHGGQPKRLFFFLLHRYRTQQADARNERQVCVKQVDEPSNEQRRHHRAQSKAVEAVEEPE